MRSLYASMLALAMTVLLCACVSNAPVWETVDDELPLLVSGRGPSSIVFAAPDGAVRQTFADTGTPQVYAAPDGSYEITACVLAETDADAVIEQLTGFDAGRVDKVATTRFSLPAYDFAWSAAGDEGDRVYRAEVLFDEDYCYALCFSVPAGSGTKYDSIQDAVFASFGLNYDENF